MGKTTLLGGRTVPVGLSRRLQAEPGSPNGSMLRSAEVGAGVSRGRDLADKVG
jgi:hypothetical protein